jgi:sec-independent protein translocase protein TatB
MFDIGASELLVIVIVAVLVIGPKDLPLALRTAGRWIGKVRRVSAQFRTGFDAMVREAEMEDMEKKWKDQNAKIMADSASGHAPEGAPDTLAGETKSGESEGAGSEMTPLAKAEPPAEKPAEAKPKADPKTARKKPSSKPASKKPAKSRATKSSTAKTSTPKASKPKPGAKSDEPLLPLGKPKAE